MGRYKIKISYETGNSYRTEKTSDFLEVEWNDLSVAKENLQAIKDHYQNVYRNVERNSNKSNQEIFKKYQNEFWFVSEKDWYNLKTNCKTSVKWAEDNPDKVELQFDEYYAKQCIKLKLDNGNIMQMSCYWCGHFERLLGAEIIEDQSDMKFELD